MTGTLFETNRKHLLFSIFSLSRWHFKKLRREGAFFLYNYIVKDKVNQQHRLANKRGLDNMSKIVSRGFTDYGLALGEHEAKGKIASALLQVVEHEDNRDLTWSD